VAFSKQQFAVAGPVPQENPELQETTNDIM